MVELVYINKKYSDRIKHIIKLLRVNIMIVTKDLLKSRSVPDIESIPISSEDYINKSNNLTREKIENIMHIEVLSHLQQEFKSRNYRLSHLHTKYMFRLVKYGIHLSIFLYLKDDMPLCASCMFGTEKIRKWTTKVLKPSVHK